ncbi:MAG: hypothetical protein AAGK74_00135 [Chloroflexota bacterium]
MGSNRRRTVSSAGREIAVVYGGTSRSRRATLVLLAILAAVVLFICFQVWIAS